MVQAGKYFFVMFCVSIKFHLVSAEFFEVDVNDILSEKLMPMTLFLQQAPELEINKTRKHFYENKVEGDFSEAFTTMGYHRKMMNEYMCSNFVANQILMEISPQVPRLERRMGAANGTGKVRKKHLNHKTESNIPQDVLLSDQGSSGYKMWLTRATTLEDIQRQIQEEKSKEELNNVNRRQGFEDSLNQDDYYEEGDITGYAVHNPLKVTNDQNFVLFKYFSNTGEPDFQDVSPESYAVDASMENVQHSNVPHRSVNVNDNAPYYHSYGYSPYKHSHYHNYGHTPSHQYSTHETADENHTPAHSEGYYHPSEHEPYDDHNHYSQNNYESHQFEVQDHGQGKELGIKDFIDIALTTLAFLSFGMFILQVLMCITMNKPDNSLMMMPMEADPAANDEIIEEIRRKRSLPVDRIAKINEISRRVLISIESILQAQRDEGKCLQSVICDNNKYARQQKDGQKMWIPVWGLGLNWLSARFVSPKNSTTATLNSLKAAAIGLGGGDCGRIYSSCDFEEIFREKERMKRELRRNDSFEWFI